MHRANTPPTARNHRHKTVAHARRALAVFGFIAVAVAVLGAWLSPSDEPAVVDATDNRAVVASTDADGDKPTIDQTLSVPARVIDQAALEAKRAAAEEARKAAEAQRKAEAEAKRRAELKAQREAEQRAEAAAEAQRSLERAREDPQSAARTLMADYGWGEDEFSCLDSLWTKESNWQYDAENPSSGAYGIPQSLPAEKMAEFGSDYLTNPVTQIKWGLSYINDVYGTPCSAWSHSQATNWY